ARRKCSIISRVANGIEQRGRRHLLGIENDGGLASHQIDGSLFDTRSLFERLLDVRLARRAGHSADVDADSLDHAAFCVSSPAFRTASSTEPSFAEPISTTAEPISPFSTRAPSTPSSAFCTRRTHAWQCIPLIAIVMQGYSCIHDAGVR